MIGATFFVNPSGVNNAGGLSPLKNRQRFDTL